MTIALTIPAQGRLPTDVSILLAASAFSDRTEAMALCDRAKLKWKSDRPVEQPSLFSAMKTRHFTVVVYQEEDLYIAECPEVGTVDQGATIEEAIAGVREATRLYLEEFPLPKTSPRLITSIEVECA